MNHEAGPEKLYPEDWWPTQAQQVAVIRAMNSLARNFRSGLR